jgi:hypothetical protein
MRIMEIKCTNCGGKPEFNGGVVCPYCNTALLPQSEEEREALDLMIKAHKRQEWQTEEVRAAEAGKRAMEDRAAAERQQQEWRGRKLCIHCGGGIGLTGKCRLCRKSNSRAMLRFYVIIFVLLIAVCAAIVAIGAANGNRRCHGETATTLFLPAAILPILTV